jgi:hypothetical protein
MKFNAHNFLAFLNTSVTLFTFSHLLNMIKKLLTPDDLEECLALLNRILYTKTKHTDLGIGRLYASKLPQCFKHLLLVLQGIWEVICKPTATVF